MNGGSAAVSFLDVPADAYYAKAVAWAVANGMDAVTLQELVGGYADAAQIPDYALPAFNWALGSGIVQGADDHLLPNDDCTRAQIVTMLYRLLG